MIYTVTCNPSLDYIVNVDDFQLGRVNRTVGEKIYAGGKGINVSIVLKNLGFSSVATGFLAGFTGGEIRRLLKEQELCEDFIEVENGFSRINLKLRSHEESEINGMGPAVGKEEIQKLYRKLAQLKDGDILVLAGSIPSSMPETVYMDIMKYLSGKKIKIVVDATKDLLKNALTYRPFLVKPNHHELGEIFGVELNGKRDVIRYAKQLQQMGAVNVLVSMAGDGAVLVDEVGKIYESAVPKGNVVNSVGAGDSMVAGFLAGYLDSGDYQEAFLTGVCAGSASAFSESFATKEEVERLKEKFLLQYTI